jgi:hypothetical protein
VPFVIGASASTASRSAIVTIMSRPSVWDGTVLDINLIWVSGEAEYFLRQDWTGQITLIPFNNFAFTRNAG